jgi:hypothetical protein
VAPIGSTDVASTNLAKERGSVRDVVQSRRAGRPVAIVVMVLAAMLVTTWTMFLVWVTVGLL